MQIATFADGYFPDIFIEGLAGDLSTVQRVMTSSSKRNNDPPTAVAGRWNFRQIETPLGADYDHLASSLFQRFIHWLQSSLFYQIQIRGR